MMGYCQQISEDSGFRDNTYSGFDTVIEWLVIALLAFMPLAFGVVHAWSKEIVVIFSAAIAFCFLLKLFQNREAGVIWTWAYVPVAAFLIVVLIQLIPLPANVVNIFSPNTVAVKKELLGDQPNSDTLLKSVSISFYAYATKHDLRLVLSAALVFLVVFNVFRRSQQIKRLLMAIAIIGGVIAVITLGQNLFNNGKIYWFVPTRYGNGYSGPFVNHSNYGQFVNLSVGAALAYIFVKLREEFAHREISPVHIFDYFSSRASRTFWLLIAIIVIGTSTVFISLTRGGMISMLIALVFTTVGLAWRRSFKNYGWIMIIIAMAAFTCVLYTGFEAVYQRLASIRSFQESQSGRFQILKDIGVMWTKFPLLGTGLGTHSVVYPMFDRSTISALAAHAENEYAQVLEETGLAGFGVLIIFGFIIWSSYLKCVRNGAAPISSAAYGLGFGLLAILIHSLSDFGQHLPANAFLTAIFCALMITVSEQECDRRYILRWKSAALKVFTLLAVSAVLIWGVIDSNNARVAEIQWNKVIKIEKSLASENWQAASSKYNDLLSYASAATKHEPQNIKYQYWLNVYRWHSVPREIDSDTKQAIFSEESFAVIRDIAEQLRKIRILCPTYGQAYSVAGQIETLVLNDERGPDDIRKGFRLAPCDATACFMAGYLDVLEGKIDECFPKFKKAFQLDDRLFKDVADMYIYQLNRPELAFKASGETIGHLRYVAGAFLDMQYNDMAELTVKKIKDLLEIRCSGTEASGGAFESLARIYARQHKKYAAIECYRRALALDYSQVHWRIELAKLLAETQQIPEAVKEIKICLRLRPGLKTAEELLEQFSVNPAGFSKEISVP
jgi:tetratricopeptide (TPR) repeat protein